MKNKLLLTLSAVTITGFFATGTVMADPFYDVSRLSTKETSFEKRQVSKAEPWAPEGLEAVWSAQHSGHPDFMDVRRKEYKTQKDATRKGPSISGGIVNLYEQGRNQVRTTDLISLSVDSDNSGS